MTATPSWLTLRQPITAWLYLLRSLLAVSSFPPPSLIFPRSPCCSPHSPARPTPLLLFSPVIQNQIDFGSFPSDPSAVYVLLTSADLIDSGRFCDPLGYCGFHARFNATGGQALNFAFIGHADNCLRSCAPQQ